jgi:hypothetical protein
MNFPPSQVPAYSQYSPVLKLRIDPAIHTDQSPDSRGAFTPAIPGWCSELIEDGAAPDSLELAGPKRTTKKPAAADTPHERAVRCPFFGRVPRPAHPGYRAVKFLSVLRIRQEIGQIQPTTAR